MVEVFGDFCRMAACAYSVGQREDEYLEVAGRYSKEELKMHAKAMGILVEEMESNPFEDILGEIYTEIAPRSSAVSRGEFYTPPPVCTLMASLCGGIERFVGEGRPFTVHDPCSGSGGLVLALARELAPKSDGEPSHVDLMRATCVDLNPIAADMCYITTTLWGIPASVCCGNSLTMEMRSGWKNIHWIRVREDERQRTEQTVSAISRILAEGEKATSRDDPAGGHGGGGSGADITFGRDGDQIIFEF